MVLGVGEPDSGKTKAGNVALASVGGYPRLFFQIFTGTYNGQLAFKTTMGSKLMIPMTTPP